MNTNVIVYADLKDLWSQIPLTVVMLVSRYFLEKYCFASLGRLLKIQDEKRKTRVREEAYKEPSRHKYLDITKRQMDGCHLRRSQDKVSALVKFSENMWTGTFYLHNFLFGFYVLWDKVWLWDVDQFYIGYPHHDVTSDIWWYYMISSSFYWSRTFTHFFDVRRKDFWLMFLHHIAAVLMLSLSWMCNLHRVGTLLVFLHDSAGFIFGLGKAAKSAGFGITAVYAVFVVVWILTRLVLFPLCILTRTTAAAIATGNPWFHTLNLLLWVLLLMHVTWTWMIFKVVYSSATSGKEPGDIRSSSSDDSSSEKDL